ncbi:MAG: hypothetical protein WC810_22695 [Janthinobacterium sp.]|jgi:hypothetical protein
MANKPKSGRLSSCKNLTRGRNKMINKKEKIAELLKDTILEDLELDECEDANDTIEYLEERINEDEVIYYNNAIRYLSENDASLTKSIGIACDMGYELKNINSELLATLLQQQNMREELANLQDEIKEIIEGE